MPGLVNTGTVKLRPLHTSTADRSRSVQRLPFAREHHSRPPSSERNASLSVGLSRFALAQASDLKKVGCNFLEITQTYAPWLKLASTLANLGSAKAEPSPVKGRTKAEQSSNKPRTSLP